VESASAVHRELRAAMRQLERLLSLAPAPTTGHTNPARHLATGAGGGVATTASTASTQADSTSPGAGAAAGAGGELTASELGQLLSLLHRLQSILVLNSSHFDGAQLRMLQEVTAPTVLLTRLSPLSYWSFRPPLRWPHFSHISLFP